MTEESKSATIVEGVTESRHVIECVTVTDFDFRPLHAFQSTTTASTKAFTSENRTNNSSRGNSSRSSYSGGSCSGGTKPSDSDSSDTSSSSSSSSGDSDSFNSSNNGRTHKRYNAPQSRLFLRPAEPVKSHSSNSTFYCRSAKARRRI